MESQHLRGFLDTVFDTSVSGLCLLDPEGSVLRVNSPWLEAAGVTREEMLGRNIWAVFPASTPEIRALHDEARSSGKVCPVPPRVVQRDGREECFEGTVAPVALEGGVGLLLSVSDVTRSRAIEDRLHTSEARFQRILDGMAEGCRVLDHELRYRFVNRAVLRQTQKTEADFLGRTIFELFPELADSPICAALQRSMAERVPTRIEHELKLSDGSVSWFDLSVQPIDEGLFVLSVDITERKRAEAMLRASEARFHDVLDHMLEGAQLLSHDFRYLYVNEAVTQHGGKRAEELLGRTMTEVYPGIEATEVYRHLERCMTARSPARLENEFHFADGTSRWFDLSIQPRPEGLFVLSIDITERKQAEAALHRVRDELHAIFNASPVAFVAFDLEARVRLWSAAAERVFGWRSDEIVGLQQPLVPADKLDEFQDVVRRTAASETIRDLHTVRLARDGRRVPVALSVAPLLDGSGVMKGRVAVIADLTKEQALRSALSESELRYATLFESSPNAKILVRARDHAIVEVNSACLRLFDLSRDEVLRTGSLGLRHDEGVAARDRFWALLLSEGSVSDFQLQFQSARRGHGEALLSATILSLQGEPHALVSIQDVTERKAASSALQESEARFRQVVDTIDEVFWLTDPEKGEVIYISPGYERIWGRTCDALYLRSRDWMDAVHVADRDRVQLAAMTKQVNGTYDEQYRVVRPDGTVRWIRDRAYPVRNAAGEVVRIAGSAQDITGQRELEAQLRQTQKMESVGQLAGGVAHDFNNLLMVIDGGREALSDLVGRDPACAELLDEISVGCQRAASLTHQLLAFSRRDVVEPRVIALDEIVIDTERMLRRILGEDVSLQLKPAPEALLVNVDPGSWVQVLMNLAVNARDAMPRGGKLTVETSRVILDDAASRAHPHVSPGPFARLCVSDTGTGMPQEVQARVFEPFFTTKGVGKGTGLGLSVVHGIVTQGGGFIEVSSEVGVGTTFRAYVPIVEGDPLVMSRKPEGGEDRGTETILLVEDEESIRRLAHRALSQAGYTVIDACDGEQALALAAGYAGPIHLLVTDVVMPNLDGRSLSQALTAARPELLVLFTSGYTDDTVLRYGVQHAEVAFLAKPYPLVALKQRVRALLDHGARREVSLRAPRPSLVNR
jgi:PAS domain S-box-containing protein